MFLQEDLPLPVQFLWLEGKPVPICAPQNHFKGHIMYRGTAPIFVTTPEEALAGLSTASAQQPQGQAGMLLRRLKIFGFTQKLPMPPDMSVPACGHCFVRMVSDYTMQPAA